MASWQVVELGPLGAIVELIERISRMLPDTAADRALLDARAAATRLDREAITPVFEAVGRDEYWAARDGLFEQGADHWLSLVHDLVASFKRVDPGILADLRDGEAASRAIEKLERQPPRWLSAAARTDLREGFELGLRLEKRFPSPAGAEPPSRLPSISPADDPRLQRIGASVLLLGLWSTFMVAGRRPRSDEVADSIARNFAAILGGYAGMTGLAQPPPADE